MQDKKTLITIIMLLVIFLPLAVYGTYMHAQGESVIIDDNPNKEYILNNKVYFYNSGVLTSTYECTDNCSVATPVIDDDQYNINYYSLGTKEATTFLSNGYALFQEGNYIVLYNTALNSKLLQFDLIKDYSIEHTHPVLIIKSNGLYGVISLNDMQPMINYKYDFIGIPNRVNDGVLDTSKFIAKSGSYWYVLESDGTYNHEAFREPIIDFNSKYVIVKNLGIYKIYDYTKNEYLSTINKKHVYCIGEYVIVINSNNGLEIYSDMNLPSIRSMSLPNYTNINFSLIGNKIDIFIDGNSYQSIVLN